ncbi:MAG: hypothetical protein WBR18_05300 [Anaerolineales bacterium]
MAQSVSLAAVLAMAARVTVDSDTFWHLAAGRWIVQHGEILRTDPFSVTRYGQPWVYPGWLSQLLLFNIHRALGWLGLNLFTMVAVLLVFAIVWEMLSGPPLLRAFVLTLSAAASAIFWSARPQMLTLLLAAGYLWVLRREDTGPSRELWLLPPLMALWANLHGGFAVGFLLVGAYLGAEVLDLVLTWLLKPADRADAWERRRPKVGRLALCLGLCLLAVGINPFGFRMLGYPFQTVAVETLRLHIQEWQSPDFHMTETWPFLAMLLLMAPCFALSTKKRQTSEIVLYLGFSALALSAVRNIALFAVVAAPALARHGGSAIQPLADAIGSGRQLPGRLSRRLNALLAALLVIAAALWAGPRIGAVATEDDLANRFPAGALAYLNAQKPAGPIFNSYNWGGYLLWTSFPQYKSFVDGRTDLFNDEILTDYLSVYTAGRGWERILDSYGVKLILVEPSAPLAVAAEGQGWHRLFLSDQSVLLSKTDGG